MPAANEATALEDAIAGTVDIDQVKSMLRTRLPAPPHIQSCNPTPERINGSLERCKWHASGICGEVVVNRRVFYVIEIANPWWAPLTG